jgi:hypothetical protein
MRRVFKVHSRRPHLGFLARSILASMASVISSLASARAARTESSWASRRAASSRS